jgi:hypothetical protein
LNTALPNNKRSQGVQLWGTHDSTIDLNTVYDDPITGQPCVGLEAKNSGQYNLTWSRNYINLTHYVGGGVEGSVAIAEDITGTSSVYSTVVHNIAVGPGAFGVPSVVDSILEESPIKIANNTSVGTNSGSTGAVQRFSLNATQTITFYNNIISHSGTPTGRGDVDWNVDGVVLTDYNLYPADFGLGLSASGAGNYPTVCGNLCKSFVAFAAAILPSTIGKDAHSLNGVPTFENASGTMLKATDYKLTATSAGHMAGSSDGRSTGGATDIGAWGDGATAIGAQWKDPF